MKVWVAIDHQTGWTGYAGPFYSQAEVNVYIEKVGKGGIESGISGFRVLTKRPPNNR